MGLDFGYFFRVSLSLATTSGLFSASINAAVMSGVCVDMYGICGSAIVGIVIVSGYVVLCCLTARSRLTSVVTYSDIDLYGEFSPLHNCKTCVYISGDTHPVSGFFLVKTDVMFSVIVFIVSLL